MLVINVFARASVVAFFTKTVHQTYIHGVCVSVCVCVCVCVVLLAASISNGGLAFWELQPLLSPGSSGDERGFV